MYPPTILKYIFLPLFMMLLYFAFQAALAVFTTILRFMGDQPEPRYNYSSANHKVCLIFSPFEFLLQ